MENKNTKKTKLVIFIVVIVINALLIYGLVAFTLSYIKTSYYKNAEEAFARGEYEVFSHYFNRSEKEEFFIPEGEMKIPVAAFDECEKLKFNEYDGCAYIGSEDNPYFCLVDAVESLEVYVIHEDTKLICDGAFRGRRNIKEFIVSSENESFLTIEGTLYTSDGSRLIHYATVRTDREFTVPESVREIDAYGFYYASHLREISLPEGLISIGECAFGFNLIDFIKMPNTAVVIGEGAFASFKRIERR